MSLDVADVTFGADGLIVQLRRSKTDQAGEGRNVGLPFGPGWGQNSVATLKSSQRPSIICRSSLACDRRRWKYSLSVISATFSDWRT